MGSQLRDEGRGYGPDRHEEGEESLERLLTALDRLGERVRNLSAQPASRLAVAPERPRRDSRGTPRSNARDGVPGREAAGVDLQRAVEEIARKRDALDRDAARRESEGHGRSAGQDDRGTPAGRSRDRRPEMRNDLRDETSRATSPARHDDFYRDQNLDVPEPSARAAFRSFDDGGTRAETTRDIRRLADRIDVLARRTVDERAMTTLRDDLHALREAVQDGVPHARVKALEAAYDEIVGRLDQMRSAIDNPRTVSDLVQRLAEIRRLLAQTPSEADMLALSDRIDAIADRIDSGRDLDRQGVLDIQRQIATLAGSVSGVDPSAQLQAIERRLADVGSQVVAVEQRLVGLDDVMRWQESVDRQSTVLSKLAQRTEQLPRVVQQVERQSATVEGLARSLDTLPELAAHLAELRRVIDAQSDRPEPDFASDFAELRRAIEARTGSVAPELSADLAEIRRAIEAQAGIVVPDFAADLAEIRRAIAAQPVPVAPDLDVVIDRIDALAARVENNPARVDEALERRLFEITDQLARIEGPLEARSLAALETRIGALAAAVERGAGLAPIELPAVSLPPDLMDALSRIEAHLAQPAPVDRFADLEVRIDDLARAMRGLEDAAAPDLSGIEATLSALRQEISSIGTPAIEKLETEIRALAASVESLSARESDDRILAQVEFRLADIASRIETAPDRAGDVLDAIARMERTIGSVVEDQRRVVREVQSRPSTPDSGDIQASVVEIRADLLSLQSTLRETAGRDRDLLVAIGEAVERLALREIAHEQGAARAPEAREAEAMDARPATSERPRPARRQPIQPEKDSDLDEEVWTEIQRTLTVTAPPRKPEPDVEPGLLPRLFGRRDKASAARVEPAVAPSLEPAVEHPDPDRPLEPGSGKPAPFSAQDAAVRRGQRPVASDGHEAGDGPRAEPTKADFIAAARRAAMAAGEPEAPDARRAQPGTDASAPPARRGIGSTLSRHRRQILTAVAALVVVVYGVRTILPMVVPAAPPVAAAVEEPLATTDEDTVEVGPSPTDGGADSLAPLSGGTDSNAAPAAMPDTLALAPSGTEPGSFGAAPTTPPAGYFQPVEGAGTAAADQNGMAGDGMAAGQPGAVDTATNSAANQAGAVPLPPSPPTLAGETMPAGETVPAGESTPDTAPTSSVGLPLPPEAVGPMALRQAAADGDPIAQFEVAARFSEARGVPQNLEEAVVWYTRSAERGQPVAQYRLGSLYEKGHGTARDPAAAIGWYTQAANAGNVTAMHNVAVMTASGAVNKPDYATAAKWFEAAAEHGVRDSQFNLAVLYANGSGVPRDLAASYKWFALAAQAGDADASKMRDNVAQELDKDTLARARLAVETWAARTPDPASNVVKVDNPAWVTGPETTASITASEALAGVQRLLTARGFDAGPADGQMGKRTRDAISAYQAEMGMPVTGEIDDKLVASLLDRTI